MAQTSARVRAIVGSVLRMEPDLIEPNDSLVCLGVDLFTLSEIITGVEKEFGITIAEGAEDTVTTINDLRALVDHQITVTDHT